jgi:UDPglucose--hexose-1-phosphate uridylyltransferase
MPQLRQNIITGEWVVIAPERARRPSEYITEIQSIPKLPKDDVFAVTSDNYKKNRLHDYDTENVYVITNKYPAFVEPKERGEGQHAQIEQGFYHSRAAIGGHDVVIIKDGETTLPHFTRAIWRDLLHVTQRRYQYFDDACGNESTMWIYNHHPQAGASIAHPHAQIFSSNITPNLLRKELAETEHYWQSHGRNAFDDLITHEQTFRNRVLFENEHYIAFTQYAARFPFETWILPKYQADRLEHISEEQLAATIPALTTVLGKLNKTLKDPPLNMFIHSAPHTQAKSEWYRWHIEIIPRLNPHGGFELGSQVYITVMSPELAAQYLNDQRQAD